MIILLLIILYFFFSSRRRHTRSKRDWSSDVCSSDLLPPIRWGIGINTGPAVVGNMGSRSRLQYTALGDTVNTAARFCSHAPAFQVLIGEMTYQMCKDYIAVDLVPGVRRKGKSAEPFRIS